MKTTDWTNRSPATISNETQIADALPAKLPRVSPIKLSTLGEIRTELGKLYREARAGRLDTQDATRLAYLLSQLREMHLAMEIEARLFELERRTLK